MGFILEERRQSRSALRPQSRGGARTPPTQARRRETFGLILRPKVCTDMLRPPMANPNVTAHPMLLTFTHVVNLLCRLLGGARWEAPG